MIHWSMTSEAMWPQFWSGLDPRLVSDPLAPSNSWSTFKPKRLRITCLGVCRNVPVLMQALCRRKCLAPSSMRNVRTSCFFWGAGCGCFMMFLHKLTMVTPCHASLNQSQHATAIMKRLLLRRLLFGRFRLIFFAFLIDFGYRHGCWSVVYLRLEALWQQWRGIFSPCLVFGFFPTCPNSRQFVNLGDTLGLGKRSCTAMRQCILDSAEFLACYELLLKEVVCPFLKFKMIEDMGWWHEWEWPWVKPIWNFHQSSATVST